MHNLSDHELYYAGIAGGDFANGNIESGYDQLSDIEVFNPLSEVFESWDPEEKEPIDYICELNAFLRNLGVQIVPVTK